MGVSSTLLSCINCILLCISLPFLAVGFFIKNAANSPCDPIMYKPLIAVGGALLVISLLGMLGGCCGLTFLLWLYAIAVLILILGLFTSLIVGGVIIKGAGGTEDVGGTGVKEYQLGGFSSWLRNRIVGDEAWGDISECMVKNHACNKMGSFRSLMDFMSMEKSKLSSIETGCCKPPGYCGYEFEEDTTWKVPEKGLSSQDGDCKAWDNDKEKLCYNCDSCKAGYLALFVKGWKKITVLNSVLLVISILIFMIAICAIC